MFPIALCRPSATAGDSALRVLQSGNKRDAKAIVAAMGTVVFPSEPSHCRRLASRPAPWIGVRFSGVRCRHRLGCD